MIDHDHSMAGLVRRANRRVCALKIRRSVQRRTGRPSGEYLAEACGCSGCYVSRMICGDPAARRGSKWLMLHVALTEEECRWLAEIPTFGGVPLELTEPERNAPRGALEPAGGAR